MCKRLVNEQLYTAAARVAVEAAGVEMEQKYELAEHVNLKFENLSEGFSDGVVLKKR
ncbi:hypothetical protein [Geotalea sp. SG265]|uniref:hypothetical protein n=1 Tax=Geotalea sp. SG265 TaxID=2922867 RepID=UPI001FAF0584|nr:hypothetical protein [Geotalea sp. SG265]